MIDVSGKSNQSAHHSIAYHILLPLFCIALLQASLFIPLYVTKYAEGRFFPGLSAFISRTNPDIFRWSLDYAAVVVISWIGYRRIKIPLWSVLISSVYLLLLLFQTYYFISWKIYGEKPIWSYDWALIVRVLPVFMKTMQISPILFYSILFLVAVLIFIVVNRLHRFIINSINHFSTVYLILPVCLVFVVPWVFYLFSMPLHPTDNRYPVIHWIANDMQWTFTESRIKPMPVIGDEVVYKNYYDLPVQSKPNIYLIFIEAYGSIAGAVSPYQQEYQDRLKLMESRLSARNWQSVSTLSNSTILGGRSWLGFTTLMSGLRIDNHPAYEKLIQDHTDYPQLMRVLNRFGYHTYRLNTMANFGLSFEKLDSLAIRFYGHKTWTKYSDLPYQGYRYDYFGGIPDQFALNYWEEQVLIKEKQPYFLFFITLNTHAPFYLPPPLLDNWKDLNSIKTSPHQTTRAEAGPPVYRYVQDVLYDLSFLEKYILEKADTNSLFILVGDHQPAGMEYLLGAKTDTYATPMHIITRDSRWIGALRRKGFDTGMQPVLKPGSLLRHEGFYSFFMQTWAEVDSLPSDQIPSYLPYGLQ